MDINFVITFTGPFLSMHVYNMSALQAFDTDYSLDMVNKVERYTLMWSKVPLMYIHL